MVGLSYKYAKKPEDAQRSISRVMPSYGLYDQNSTMKSTRKAMDASKEEIDLEL